MISVKLIHTILVPLYYLGHALREVMVQGRGLGAVWPDILVVGGMGVACFLASVKLFRSPGA